MKKIVLLAAVAALFVGMLGAPASAHPDEAGVFTGTAAVGKSGSCAQDGTGSVSGAGLGFPVLAENGKTGYWTLNTVITGLVHGTLATGQLRSCGLLAPTAGLIGAACGVSEGHSGKGTVALGGTDHISLTNLGWITSAGGTLPVTGNTTDAGTKNKNGTVVALTQAQGGAACATKSGSGAGKTGGATEFTVVGVFASTGAATAPKA